MSQYDARAKRCLTLHLNFIQITVCFKYARYVLRISCKKLKGINFISTYVIRE